MPEILKYRIFKKIVFRKIFNAAWAVYKIWALIITFMQNDTVYNSLHLAIFAGFLAIVAQSGDIFESWLKRKFGVKDSGNIIPGHGGILDRLDSFTSVAPFLAIMYVTELYKFILY